MRIATSMNFNNFVYRQQQLSAAIFRDENRLSTGRAVNVPSDQPIDASRLLKLSEVEESQNQVLENIRFASDFLNAADGALADVSASIIRVQELASGAVSSIAIPEEREAAAIEIDSIIEQLTSTANRQYLGLYLFGGREVEAPPVVHDLDGLRYVGDVGDLTSRLALDRDREFNITADAVFGMLSEGMQGTVDLDPILTRETRVDELAGARNQGLRLGALRFDESGIGAFTADLTEANSVGEIIDLVNQAAQQAGSTLRAEIAADGRGLRITPGAEVAITGVDNSVTATDLGIVTNQPTSAEIVSLDLNRHLTAGTRISELLGGAGLEVEGASFRIINGSHSASIDLTAAETVEDIINAISQAGVGVRAIVNEQQNGINVQNEVSGSVMSIVEESGAVAAELGLRTFAASTELALLNEGQGVRTAQGQDDLRIIARDGTSVAVNLDGAETVADVLDLINEAAAAAGVDVEATLGVDSNGIRITDSTGGAGSMQFQRMNFSEALNDLGFDVAVDPQSTEYVARDVSGIRVEGLFSSLVALRDSLRQGNERQITAAAGEVDEAFKHITRVQGQLGAEVRAIEQRAAQTQQAVDATGILLSQVRDLDFAEAITRFQQTQTALQASLLASGQSLNLSLLNFLS